MRYEKEDIYQYISWGISFIPIILAINNSDYIQKIFLIVTVVLLIIIQILCRKYKKAQCRLLNYEKLFFYTTPLYGLLNYIVKNKNVKYINDCLVKEVILHVKVKCGSINMARNDLEFSWTVIGQNINSSFLRQYWIRFGGENPISFKELNFCCYDYSDLYSDNAILDKYRIKTNYKSNYRILIDENTYKLVEINFNKPITQYQFFSLNYKYVWSGCYNPSYDHIIIDTANFSARTKKLYIRIYVDNVTITPKTKIHMFSADKENYNCLSEGKFFFCENKEFFEKIISPSSKLLYYAVIINEV